MRLASTKHSGFRGLFDEEHTFSDDINLILGHNGEGKTSLIEAIYVSILGTPLNSFSRAGRELSRNTEAFFSAESLIIGSRGNLIKHSFSSSKSGKIHSVDDQQITIREAYLNTPVSLIDSNIEKIASESPDYRRKLIDRSVFHVEPSHAECYKKLQKAIKQRNQAIKNGDREEIVNTWDKTISTEGEKVTENRKNFIEDLKGELAEIQTKISTKEISLEFKKGWGEGDLSAYLEKNIKRDIAAKRTMGGPHRADMFITMNGKPAREYSSKGEEKQMSLTISLGISKLVEKKTGALPLLLIDELESGLDEQALIRITKYIKNLNNQRLITALDHHKIKEILSAKTIRPKQYNC